MIFSNRITNIQSDDKVLEIGPGGNPHPRANVLLEKIFEDEEEFFIQRGRQPKLITDKRVEYYNGNLFPFEDKEFDYVICSHVLEHVDDIDNFINEINRVGKKGYIEFPTLYYDYLYNFHVHKTFLLLKNNVIYWMPKEESPLAHFKSVQLFFHEALVKKHNSLNTSLCNYFFQGFEWELAVQTKRVYEIDEVCYDLNDINNIPVAIDYIPNIDLNKINIWSFIKFKLKKALYHK